MRSRTLHGQNTLQFRATSELLRDCDLLETSLSFSRPRAPRPPLPPAPSPNLCSCFCWPFQGSYSVKVFLSLYVDYCNSVVVSFHCLFLRASSVPLCLVIVCSSEFLRCLYALSLFVLQSFFYAFMSCHCLFLRASSMLLCLVIVCSSELFQCCYVFSLFVPQSFFYVVMSFIVFVPQSFFYASMSCHCLFPRAFSMLLCIVIVCSSELLLCRYVLSLFFPHSFFYAVKSCHCLFLRASSMVICIVIVCSSVSSMLLCIVIVCSLEFLLCCYVLSLFVPQSYFYAVMSSLVVP